jgi:hypothetical protein
MGDLGLKAFTKRRLLVRAPAVPARPHPVYSTSLAGRLVSVCPQEEMLHGLQTSGTGGEDWKVLVVDDVTVKVFSSACKLSDVTEENVSRASPCRVEAQVHGLWATPSCPCPVASCVAPQA